MEPPYNGHLSDQFSLSVVERCPLYGDAIFCHTIIWDKDICSFFGGVRCIEVSINRGSVVNDFKICLARRT